MGLAINEHSDGILLTEEVENFLKMCVRKKLNILLSGMPDSAVMTVLQKLVSHIDHERVIFIQDEPKEAEIESFNNPVSPYHKDDFLYIAATESISKRKIAHTAMKLNASRIIFENITGDEAEVLLEIWASGYIGSMAVIHEQKPYNALLKIASCFPGSVLKPSIDHLIKEAAYYVEVVIQTEKLTNGSAVISSISVFDYKDGKVNQRDLFVFDKERNALVNTGVILEKVNSLEE